MDGGTEGALRQKKDGFLIPPWYEYQTPNLYDLNIASIIWGFSLACAVFTLKKAIRQSWRSYKRGKIRNPYIVMVWAEWTVCVTISVVVWLFLSPSSSVLPSFWLYFGLLCLWVIQIQCILQIIINRVRLLMTDQRRADHLKWTVAIFIGLINISVFIIWIPARLQISQKWIGINNWWDRVEKALFGAVDIGLNLYFVYLIRSRLIANGLTKYQKLFRFNMMMSFISMSLDVLLIGVMSLPSNTIYLQFHPLVYLVKLHIEMNIAELIVKVVKATNHLNEYGTERQGVHITPPGGGAHPSHRLAGGNIHRSSGKKVTPLSGDLEDWDTPSGSGNKSRAEEEAFDQGPFMEDGGGGQGDDHTINCADEGVAQCEETAVEAPGDKSEGNSNCTSTNVLASKE
ncbi:hypothetical protein JX266_002566 [Neoarthrinium moseri]|nr:hypothetical protein JX266_002566 [Neoarthrinium moseri]